jgi:hypothetical protein
MLTDVVYPEYCVRAQDPIPPVLMAHVAVSSARYEWTEELTGRCPIPSFSTAVHSQRHIWGGGNQHRGSYIPQWLSSVHQETKQKSFVR